VNVILGPGIHLPAVLDEVERRPPQRGPDLIASRRLRGRTRHERDEGKEQE
jgi:hypothetical protein